MSRTLVVAVLLISSLVAPVAAAPWEDQSLSPETRATLLVNAMTTEEKSAMLWASGRKVVGEQVWQVHVKGNERLGIPDLTMADGSTGLRGGTQMPAPIALGATFSRSSAQTYGDLLGVETNALGYGVLLAPTVNLARDPRHGRTFEGLGEDPYLIGQLAVPETQAIQAHGVMADLKHLAVNNIERDREVIDVTVESRTMQELYLPHFRDVVTQAAPDTVMCSFNKINGVHACDSSELLERLLRQRWGFDGFVRTDANAYHTTASVEHGLEQELPKELVFNDALDPVALDRAAWRVLRAMIASGVFDNPPQRTGVDVAAGAQIAQQLAEEATVLLRNQSSLLPLPATGSVALIGGDADTTATYGGGSSNIAPAQKDTILAGLQSRLSSVSFAKGVDPISPVSVLPGYDATPSAVLTGLSASYYRQPNFTSLIASRAETCVCYDDGWYADGGTIYPKPPGKPVSVRWTGTLTAPATGEYGLDLSGYDSAQVYLDGQPAVDASGIHDLTPRSATVNLTGGQARQLRIDMVITAGNPFVDVSRKLKFGWDPPTGVVDSNIAAAAAMAAQAHTAIVVVRDYQSESTDRVDLHLPNHQDALVRAVVAANPRTVVVLTTGSAVTMPWATEVPAIVQAWYGGTAAGAALARVLLGDVNPAGRLPISFPASTSDLSTNMQQQFPGADQLATYSEGMRVGYRHHESSGGPAPLYPFGYGLSYTTFSYSDLALNRTLFTASAAGSDATMHGKPGVTVSFTVRNTGNRVGDVVPQVYVTAPGSVSRQLKGFDRVTLQAGESRRLNVVLDQQAFASFLPAADQWSVPIGQSVIQVADSSRDVRLQAMVTVTKTAGAPHLQLSIPPLVTPGQSFTVTGTLVNDGDYRLTNLSAPLTVPAGWQVTGGTLPSYVPVRSSATVTWQVTPGSAGDRLEVTLGFTAGPVTASSRTSATTRIPYPTLSAAFNNVGITADNAVESGDIDGKQHTLSATALANAGYTPGATVVASGVSFTWPSSTPDNVASYGQTIRLTGSGTRVALLATSNSAATAGWVTVIYADGTTARTLVRSPDWWSSTGAVTFPYVNTAQPLCAGGTLDGTKCIHDASLYVLSVPITPGKQVAAIMLPHLAPTPAGPTATMHVFAASIA